MCACLQYILKITVVSLEGAMTAFMGTEFIWDYRPGLRAKLDEVQPLVDERRWQLAEFC